MFHLTRLSIDQNINRLKYVHKNILHHRKQTCPQLCLTHYTILRKMETIQLINKNKKVCIQWRHILKRFHMTVPSSCPFRKSDLQVNSGKTLKGIEPGAQRQIVQCGLFCLIFIKLKEKCGQIRRKETKYRRSILERKYHLLVPFMRLSAADRLHFKQHRCFEHKQRYRYYTDTKGKKQNRSALLIVLWILEDTVNQHLKSLHCLYSKFF